MPAARPRLPDHALPRMARIVQTPTLILMAFDDGMHREIFMDGRCAGAGSQSDVDGLFGRALGRRCAGGRKQRLHRSLVARFRWPPAYRGSANHRTLHPARRRAHRCPGRHGGSKGDAKPITFSMPMALQADTEMLEGFCENHHKSRERMTSTKPAEAVHVPAATLSRYVGTYDTDDDRTKHVVRVMQESASLWFDYDGKGKELAGRAVAGAVLVVGLDRGVSTRAADGTTNLLIRYVEGDARGPRRR